MPKINYTPINIVASIVITILLLQLGNIIFKEVKSHIEHEDKKIESCMHDSNCIHTVRHLKPNVISCVQSEKCYKYLREAL